MINVDLAELMLFGLMSLLMGHWIVFVAKICVKTSSSAFSSKFFPCALDEDISSSREYLNKSVSREEVEPKFHQYCPEVVYLFMLCRYESCMVIYLGTLLIQL